MTVASHITYPVSRLAIMLLFLLLLPATAWAQQGEVYQKPKLKQGFWPFRVNRVDASGRYHGKWKALGPDDKTIARKGRFRHGKEVGTWRYYYYPSGELYMVERHKRHKAALEVKRYHENGALAKEGQAAVLETEENIRYFWYGTWKVYDTEGNFSHNEYYVNGKKLLLKR